VCWKPCSSCWSFHLLREEFLSAPIHSPLSGSPYRSFNRSRSWKIHIKSKKSENVKWIWLVSLWAYLHLLQSMTLFWLIVFAWKIEINLAYFCCSSKSTCDLNTKFGYIVVDTMCSLCTRICTKLLSESFIMIYLIFMLFFALIFFSKN
jgi:hypothetical protein